MSLFLRLGKRDRVAALRAHTLQGRTELNARDTADFTLQQFAEQPPTVTGLVAWYDADDPAQIIETFTVVSRWQDKSGHDRHVEQATGANQPSQNNLIINGRTALVFDGTNDVLISADLPDLAACTIFLVAQVFAGQAGPTLGLLDLFDPVVGSASGARFYYDTGSGTMRWSVKGSSLAELTHAVTRPTPVLLLEGLYNGSAMEYFVNGTSKGTATPGANPNAPTQLDLGRAADGGSFTNCRIAEVAIYDRALTTSERQQVERYLLHKWGIVPQGLTLPILPDPVPGLECEIIHGVELWPSAAWSHSGLSAFSGALVNNSDLEDGAFHVDSAGPGSWLQLDLGVGVTRAFRACKLYAFAVYSAVWDVEYSDNGSTWTKALTGWNSGAEQTESQRSWGAVGAHRYWRLLKTNAAAVGAYLTEVQFSLEPAMTAFAGTLDRIDRSQLSGTELARHAVAVVDYNQLAARHIVAELYQNQTMKQIVADIVTDHLAADGVKLAVEFPDGPTIEHLPFDYVTVERAFDELSELTGYFWHIDHTRILHFLDRAMLVAPSVVDAAVVLADTLSVEQTREQYRNQQYVRGGLTITDAALIERQFGDGELRTFITSLPVAKAPIVRTDIGSGFVARTVGIRQVDVGKDWYWQEGSNEISQDSAGTVLAATHRIEIEYFGYFPFITVARHQSAIDERISVEGGSGLYEQLEDHEEITKAELGRDKAEGLLKRFGSIDRRLSFRTRQSGFEPGQLASVSLPTDGLYGDYLITSVAFEDWTGRGLRYALSLVSGDVVESWVGFFKRLTAAGRRIVQRPNEVLNLLRFFPEELEVRELAPAPTTASAAVGIVRADGETQTERHKVGFASCRP